MKNEVCIDDEMGLLVVDAQGAMMCIHLSPLLPLLPKHPIELYTRNSFVASSTRARAIHLLAFLHCLHVVYLSLPIDRLLESLDSYDRDN